MRGRGGEERKRRKNKEGKQLSEKTALNTENEE